MKKYLERERSKKLLNIFDQIISLDSKTNLHGTLAQFDHFK